MTKESAEQAAKAIEDRILHILDCFPKVSPSMLQISLGSGVPTSLWHGVLDKLIADERLYRYKVARMTPAGRQQIQTVISIDPPEADEDVIECSSEDDND